MKIPIYIKIAKTKKGVKVEASEKPSNNPIIGKSGYRQSNIYHPTIFFGIEIDLPENAFDHAKKIIAKIDYRLDEVVNVDEDTQTDIRVKINKTMIDNLKK